MTLPELNGQDTVKLRTVEIQTARQEWFRTGKRTDRPDSLIKQQFLFNSLADLLQNHAQLYIKSYGPGALATTALRGGNAQQTALLWNGFNLQNAMLGQNDLALLPAFLFDNAEVEYGGSSALWGSGAVGGSIHLGNRLPFGRGLRTEAMIGGGSMGQRNAAMSMSISKKRCVLLTKAYRLYSLNDFKYADDTGGDLTAIKRQQHSAYLVSGLMQEVRMIVNNRNLVGLHSWLSESGRDIAGTLFAPQHYSRQNDRTLRLSADWSYEKARYRSLTRAAFFNDRIDYKPYSEIEFDKSEAQTFTAENEHTLNWGEGQQFNAGLIFTSWRAASSNYNGQQGFYKIGLLAGNKFLILKKKLQALATARWEYFSTGKLPLTGNLALEYKALKELSLGVSAARVYRQPTLNELFWQPGGRPDIRPEQGYTLEGNASFKRKAGRFLLDISASAYSRMMKDWIMWLPGAGGNPQPANLQKVWSRGTETNSKLSYTKNKWTCLLVFGSAYVLSTTRETNKDGNESIGRQLIYTPRYTFNGTAGAQFKKTFVALYYQYAGYRFTSSDNSQWLNPYSTWSARLSQEVEMKNYAFSFFAAGHNLLNSRYYQVAGRPMPLMNLEAGLIVKFKKSTI